MESITTAEIYYLLFISSVKERFHLLKRWNLLSAVYFNSKRKIPSLKRWNLLQIFQNEKYLSF